MECQSVAAPRALSATVLEILFPANRGLSGGEKMRERRETSAGPRQVL